MRESVFSFFASSILYNIAHFGLAGAREASFFGVGLYFSIPHVSKTSLGTATGASPSPGSAAGTRTGHAVLSLACRKNANAGPASQSALSHSVLMNILFACLNRPTLAVSFWSACCLYENGFDLSRLSIQIRSALFPQVRRHTGRT